jgi:uncharacterized protein YqhQ
MKLLDILSGINPILRILCIVVLSVAAHFTVKAIRRISQKMLAMKVDRKAISEENMARRYPKIATIITILVSAVTFSHLFRGRRYGSARI